MGPDRASHLEGDASALERLLAALAGALLATAGHAFLFPEAVGMALLHGKFLVLAAGNLPPAALLGLAAPLACRCWPLRSFGPPRASRLAFWLAVAFAAGGWAGAWIGNARDFEGIWRWTVPATTALLLAVAPVLSAFVAAPRPKILAGTAAVGSLLLAALLSGLFRARLDRGPAAFPSPRGERLQLSAATAPAGSGPDVLLVCVDTLRADAILADDVPTPHLDAFRAVAQWSPYALAPAPATVPSHATLFTSVNPLQHGTRTNEGRLPGDLRTLAEQFRQAGWRTVALISNSLLTRSTGMDRGFEVYQVLTQEDPEPLQVAKVLHWKENRGTWLGMILPYPRDAQALMFLLGRVLAEGSPAAAPGSLTRDLALSYLDDLLAQPAPYFFFLQFIDPHQPYDPDPSTAGSLRGGQALPEAYRGFPPGSLYIARKIQEDLALRPDDPAARDAAALLRRIYHEEVAFVDACIGSVLERVRAGGRPTLVLVTADHGEQFGEHSLMLHDNSVYETLLEVPWLLAGPGVPPGRLESPPRLEDAAPTLLHLAGIQVPAQFQGRALVGDQPEAEAARRHPHLATSRTELAWLEDGWKLIARYSGLGTASPELVPMALYHLAEDPGEERNLLAAEPERARALLEAATRVASLAVAAAERELTPSERADLQKLGYVY